MRSSGDFDCKNLVLLQSGRGRGRELDRGNEVFVVVGVVVMVVVVLAVMVAVMVLEVVVVLAVVARLPAMRFLGYGHAVSVYSF